MHCTGLGHHGPPLLFRDEGKLLGLRLLNGSDHGLRQALPVTLQADRGQGPPETLQPHALRAGHGGRQFTAQETYQTWELGEIT